MFQTLHHLVYLIRIRHHQSLDPNRCLYIQSSKDYQLYGQPFLISASFLYQSTFPVYQIMIFLLTFSLLLNESYLFLQFSHHLLSQSYVFRQSNREYLLLFLGMKTRSEERRVGKGCRYGWVKEKYETQDIKN